jgi:hypothetical protein
MSFNDQTVKRKLSLFKQSLRFQEIAAGVFIQSIPILYLKRLYSDEADDADPVVRALNNLDDIFSMVKNTVDMTSSVEAVIEENVKNSVVLLAWKMSFDTAGKTMNEPKLVGIATISSFISSENFSTDANSVSTADFRKLQPFFASSWTYIDGMCSISPGVGRLLVLHAYSHSLKTKQKGLIALSYSDKSNVAPESKRIFDQLGFETIIPKASFSIRMYGIWYAKSTDNIDLAGITDDGMSVCTRVGFSPKTATSLIWRCAV